ncbi:MAG: DUF3352 domain-containing protein [Waterburya sp.]
MKFRSFFWSLLIGAITLFLVVVASLGWIVTQSSINILKGGVNTFPQAAMFIPKHAPAMVSLVTNPEKLNALRQVSLPLQRRQSDRQEWQQWETDLLQTIGFDYQRDLKPWLGDELTLAITSLDSDNTTDVLRNRNPNNGAQPGYLLAAATKNTQLAQKTLGNFLSEQTNLNLELYKGVNIVSQSVSKSKYPRIWSSAVVGDFVLFANQPQILKQAINQAQAVNLNLEHSDSYQTALSYIKRPHVGVAYINIPSTLAWLDKSATVTKPNSEQILSLSLAINSLGLTAETALIGENEAEIRSQLPKAWLNNPEVQQIFNYLNFNQNHSTYIDLTAKTSLLDTQIAIDKVSKLALQSLFPHLKAIAIKKENDQDGVELVKISLKLDA